jgi:catechol 2,3-dioxygenase-like lactoylglutathione lyase family enzyme
MPPVVRSIVAVTYVRDIDASRAFYELLGFGEYRSGRAATAAWTVMQQGETLVLLGSTKPPLAIPRLPLLCYVFYADLAAVVAALDAAGIQMTRTGHPPHALGGEVKVVDPDGNTLLLGQRERSSSQPPAADGEGSVEFSLLREAAAVVAAQGGTSHACRVGSPDGRPCPNKAEVKLADSQGDSAWVCLAHAEDILVTVPTAFIASQGDRGIAAFLASH